jgi:uncharacterized protein with gpF-like domain
VGEHELALIPSAYAVSKRHRILWATMNFLADRDTVGTRTRKWDRAVIKATVDRRKLILEHKAADMFRDFFEHQHEFVKEAGLSEDKITAALGATRDDLESTYKDVMLLTVQNYGPWVLGHLDATMKAPDPFAAPMVDWLREFAASRVADINKTTRDRLKLIIARGVEAGDSVEEIARGIDGLYLDEIIPDRSMTIARTEVGNAANFASNQAAQATGLPMEKTWNSLGDTFVREDHADADGQTVEQDQDFEIGGEYLGWPGDISKGATAGNVINCRCFITWDVVGG